MSFTIQLRRGTTAEWAAADPILASGEFGLDATLGKFKAGDGETVWTALPFASVLPAELTAAVDAALAAVEAGDVDSVNGQTGVVVLDAGDVGADPTGTAAGLVGTEAFARADADEALSDATVSLAPAGQQTIAGATPLNFGTQGTDAPYIKIASPTGTAGWSFNSRGVTFHSVVDRTLTLAFNHAANQTKQDAAQIQWGIQLEANYKTGVGQATQSEFLIVYTSADGATSRRPMSLVTIHDTAAAHESETTFCGRFKLNSHDGLTEYVIFDQANATVSAPALRLGSTVQLLINDFVIKRTSAGVIAFGSGSQFTVNINNPADFNAGGMPLRFYGNPSITLRTKTLIGLPGDLLTTDVPCTINGASGISVDIALFQANSVTKARINKDGGPGFWGHAAPASQPAAPVTLGDVIAVLQGCGLAAA